MDRNPFSNINTYLTWTQTYVNFVIKKDNLYNIFNHIDCIYNQNYQFLQKQFHQQISKSIHTKIKYKIKYQTFKKKIDFKSHLWIYYKWCINTEMSLKEFEALKIFIHEE